MNSNLEIINFQIFSCLIKYQGNKLYQVTSFIFSSHSYIYNLKLYGRYEFEKRRYSYLNEQELKEKLTKSGSNYEMLLKSHDQHYRTLEKTLEKLSSYNINVKVIQRFNYTLDDIKWADAILTAGGDGTFLLAATKINNTTKPIFGINTDTGMLLLFIAS